MQFSCVYRKEQEPQLSPINHQNSAPRCPKCGYDQSGAIATWEAKCPLDGQCPECGYGFAWAEVLDHLRFNLDWSIEHARTIRRMFRRTFATLWMLLIPNRYWKHMGVETPMRTGWLFLWLFLVLLTIHMLTSLVVMGNEIEEIRSIWGLSSLRNPQEWVGLTLDGLLWPINAPDWWSPLYFQGSSAYQSIYGFNSWYELMYPMDFAVTGAVRSLSLIALSGVWALVLVAVPTTRRAFNVRLIHIVRAFVITLFAIALLFEIGRGLDSIASLASLLRSLYGDLLQYDLGIMVFGLSSIGILFWTQWFWVAAISSGWKIRPCSALALTGVVASLLGGFVMYLLVVFF